MRTFILSLFIALPVLGLSQDISGDWYGQLSFRGIQLPLVFHLEAKGDGYSATMDSPKQGAEGLPVDEATFTNNQLTLNAPSLGIVYTGTYKAETPEIEGTFQQGGAQIPLRLTRSPAVEKEEDTTRPQDPTEFPYLQEEVAFANENDKVNLAGTLTLPQEDSLEAVVILVSGSGPQDRNEEVAAFNHRPFLVLSDYLTRQGIGVLRYDDRGTGASSGDHSAATTYDFAEDAAAAVRYLSQREDMEGVRIGMAGHSEGGMIAPIVATELEELDFIVLLAGPGIPIDELMLLQSDRIAGVSGIPEEIHEANQQVLSEAYTFLRKNEEMDTIQLQDSLAAIFERGVALFPEETQKEIGDVKAFAEEETKGLMEPWFLYFIRFNPTDYLSKVTIPVLAMNGTLDLQVPAEENLAAIEKALAKAENDAVTIKSFKGLNHLFQTAKTGSVEEYSQIEETFNEEAMQYLAEWIKALK